ncbi:MAG TPA: MBL fold metallo-hydrolase [Candidatus Saccharimonadales bacterium]
MKLTKYQHACFTVEVEEQILVVDPGVFSTDFIAPSNVAAVIITHEHPDHFDHDFIAQIMDKNPEAVIVAHPSVTSQIEVFNVKPALPGETLAVGPFNMEFFGGSHAVIHPEIPVIANLAVMVNDLLYYPGDSFVLPEKSVDTLALPASAPWMKVSEAADFMVAVGPRLAFPTHDAILSDAGKSINDALLQTFASQNDILYERLTDTLEI